MNTIYGPTMGQLIQVRGFLVARKLILQIFIFVCIMESAYGQEVLREIPMPREFGQGVLIENPRSTPDMGMLVLGGSEGGLWFATYFAREFALQGYSSLGLAWWGMEGLPSSMAEVDLNSLEIALAWAKSNRPRIKKWVLVGQSRGGELALVAAAHLKIFDGIIALVPSGIAMAGYREDGTETSSWKWNGKPIPYWHMKTWQPEIKHLADGRDIEFDSPAYLANMKRPEDFATAIVQLENANAPILILASEEDAVWPSCPLSEVAFSRKQRMNPYPLDKMICIPNAGHDLSFPGVPSTERYIFHPVFKLWLALGGTSDGALKAQAIVQKEIFDFLRGILGVVL